MLIDYEKLYTAVGWLAKRAGIPFTRFCKTKGLHESSIYNLRHKKGSHLNYLDRMFKMLELNPRSFVYTMSDTTEPFDPLTDFTGSFVSKFYSDTDIKFIFNQQVSSKHHFVSFLTELFNLVKTKLNSSDSSFFKYNIKSQLVFIDNENARLEIFITNDVVISLIIKYENSKILACITSLDVNNEFTKNDLVKLTMDSFTRFMNVVYREILNYKSIKI